MAHTQREAARVVAAPRAHHQGLRRAAAAAARGRADGALAFSALGRRDPRGVRRPPTSCASRRRRSTSRVRLVFWRGAAPAKISCPTDAAQASAPGTSALTGHGQIDEGRAGARGGDQRRDLATCRAQIHRAVDAGRAARRRRRAAARGADGRVAGRVRRRRRRGDGTAGLAQARRRLLLVRPAVQADADCNAEQEAGAAPILRLPRRRRPLHRRLARDAIVRAAHRRRVPPRRDPRRAEAHALAALGGGGRSSSRRRSRTGAPSTPPPPPERAPAPPAAERAPAAVAATAVLAKLSADELVDGIARLDIERQASPRG